MLVRPNLILAKKRPTKSMAGPKRVGSGSGILHQDFWGTIHLSANTTFPTLLVRMGGGVLITQRNNERGAIYNKVEYLDNIGNISAGGSHETSLDFLEKFRE